MFLAHCKFSVEAVPLFFMNDVTFEGSVVEQYKGGKWTQILNATSNATVTCRVSGLKAGTTYTFRIAAYKTAGGVTEYSGYTRLAAATE